MPSFNDYYAAENVIEGLLRKELIGPVLDDEVEVVILLETVLAEDNAVVDEVINILGELHYAVTLEFFKKAFTVLDGPVKIDFITRYLLSDKIVKNSSNFGLTRNLVIVNELLQTTV